MKKEKEVFKNGIYIGQNAKGIESAEKAILTIMKVDPKLSESSVKIAALTTLHTICKIDCVNVSNCCISC